MRKTILSNYVFIETDLGEIINKSMDGELEMKTKDREENIKRLIDGQKLEIKHLKELIRSYAPYMIFPDEKTE